MSFDNNYFRFNKPSVFISYSRDSAEHIAWVRKFAERLKAETGCRLVFDQDLLHFEDHVLQLGEKQYSFMQLAEFVDYVIPIWTDAYLDKLRATQLSGALEEHSHLITRIREKYGLERIIPVFRQPCGKTKDPGGLFDHIHGLVLAQEEPDLAKFSLEFEKLRRAVKPRRDPLPLTAFRRETLELMRITGLNGSTVELFEALGRELGDSILYANGNLEYRLSWSTERRSILVEAQQNYEVINLTHQPVVRVAFWDNSISDRFTLHSFECWAADNTPLIARHYPTNPLTRTPDGTRMTFEEQPVSIPPLNADGSGRIYCRTRWSVDGHLVGKDTLNSLKHSAFNRRMQVVEVPDDICVTLTGRYSSHDSSQRAWLFEGITLPGDTAELAWAPRSPI